MRLRARTLGEVVASRDNAFDHVRLCAALAVMWGHSYFEAPLSVDPSYGLLQGTDYEGSLAVYAFFLASGVLVSDSLWRRGSAAGFALARFARVWPGLVACTAVLCLVVAPLCSGIPLLDHRHLREAGRCILQNVTFPVTGPCTDLRGAFPDTPMPSTFGYVLWTLPLEVHCYLMVLVVGTAAARVRPTARAMTWLGLTGACALAYALATATRPAGWIAPELSLAGGYSTYPALFFMAGMAAHAARDRLRLDWRVAAGSLALGLSLPLPNPVAHVAFGYAVLVAASARMPRRLRLRSDLSYGTYVYGAAAQQAVEQVFRTTTATGNLALAVPVTLAAAWCSWHAVEAPGIRWGRRLARRIDGGVRPQVAGGVRRSTRSPSTTR